MIAMNSQIQKNVSECAAGGSGVLDHNKHKFSFET